MLEPGMVVVGETSAIVPTDTIRDDRGYRIARDWKTIALSHIVEFIDINVKPDDKRKRA